MRGYVGGFETTGGQLNIWEVFGTDGIIGIPSHNLVLLNIILL